MIGHGHVTPRANGFKVRCGGPGMCVVCALEQSAQIRRDQQLLESNPLVCVSPTLAPAAQRTIVAFTGLAGAGKSTAALHLVKHRGFARVRFAGPLKAMLAALGCTPAEIDGDRKEQPCELLGGKTPRWAMQSLGTEWGRNLIAEDLWIRAWQAAVAAVPAGVPVVVDDARFPNEGEALRAIGAIVVRIIRPRDVDSASAATASHVSEQHMIPADWVLHNTRDERNLKEQVDVLLRDLSWLSQ